MTLASHDNKGSAMLTSRNIPTPCNNIQANAVVESNREWVNLILNPSNIRNGVARDLIWKHSLFRLLFHVCMLSFLLSTTASPTSHIHLAKGKTQSNNFNEPSLSLGRILNVESQHSLNNR